MKNALVKAVAVILAVLFFMGAVVELRAREETRLAREAQQRGQDDEAIKHFSRALNWYLPLGTAEKAAEALVELGLARAGQGRFESAAKALALARGGLYGAASFYVPRRDLIARVEPVLAELTARAKLGPEAKAEDLQKQARVYLELYQKPSRPGLAPSLAAIFGFALWVGALLRFIFSGFGRGESYPRARAWLWSAPWAVGFTLWLWGMKWA
ncbi:MAG: hypothetical protein V1816_24090 [Pseudomonadota bacterium]